MNELGNKMAKKRKDLGMTQNQFAEKLSVTRQTVSRWEAGSVMPDIDKISDIAEILGVSCDYLLRDGVGEDGGTEGIGPEGSEPGPKVSRLLLDLIGRKVRLNFFDQEGDYDLYNNDCVITGFEGNWMNVVAETKKGRIEKLIPLSSVMSVERVEEVE